MERALRLILALAIIGTLIVSMLSSVALAAYKFGEEQPIITAHLTAASKQCVECHKLATPFVVYDWQKSRHYLVGVGCYECHAANPDRPDAFEHFGFKITMVVTPKQCARCHPTIAEEFVKSVHAFAGLHCYLLPEAPFFWIAVAYKPFEGLWEAIGDKIPAEYIKILPTPPGLKKAAPDVHKYVMEMYRGEPGIVAFTEDPTVAILGGAEPQGLSIEDADVKKLIILWGLQGCMACHGANLNPKFAKEVEKRTGKFAGLVFVPGTKKFDPSIVVNHGIGRINPDGSLGACEACHFAHSFSIKIARKAWEACGRCHYGADHPNDEHWKASIHGALVLGEYEDYAWEKKSNDWRPGRDYRGPTCASCHMGAVFDEQGNVKYALSHDVASICKWKLGKWLMSLLRVAGMRDPATPAWVCEYWEKEYGMSIVYPEPDWKERRKRCIEMCSQCHTKYFAAAQLRTADWMMVLVDYIRDTVILKIAGILKEKGLFTPLDKIKVRNLGAMGNRPAKMGAFHTAPDYRWWAGLVKPYVLKIMAWLKDIYHRPLVKKKAPEIIETIEEVMPWLKKQVEGEKIKVEEVLPPKIVELTGKMESVKLAFAPLVTTVDVKTVGSIYAFEVGVKSTSTSVSPVAFAALFVIPAALVEGRRHEEEQE
ncbi:MAG TPA: hypothetical protein EYH59_04245 [Pyrodictium sp.]|nr:hypothetical protein [Pyrodictium sp.]